MVEREQPMWEEKDHKPYQRERLIVPLEEEFYPFFNGITTVDDSLLPEAEDAVGFSTTFYIAELNAWGRIELFDDLSSLAKPYTENMGGRDACLIPVFAVPVISFEEPGNAEAGLTCMLTTVSKTAYARNIPNGDFDEVAVFDKWEDTVTGEGCKMIFYDENEISQIGLSIYKSAELLFDDEDEK